MYDREASNVGSIISLYNINTFGSLVQVNVK